MTRKPAPRRVKLAVTTSLFQNELQMGLPQSGPPQGGLDREGKAMPASLFLLDPEVREESIRFAMAGERPVLLMTRAGSTASIRDAEGRMV